MNNTNNDEMSGVRPVRAPGFAKDGVGSGDAFGRAMSAGGENDVVFQNKPKKSHGMLYGMILLAILAAGGIGFGVWAMLDGNSRVQKKDEQISQLQSQLAEKSEVVVEDDTTVVDDGESGDSTTSASVANTADYIYVGEWGLKIRIPEGLKKVSYDVNAYSDGDEKTLCVTGISSSTDGFPQFANLYTTFPGMGCVSRKPKDVTGYYGTIVFSNDTYDVVYQGPQTSFATNDNEKVWETEAVQLIQRMLSSEDNYSKI